MTRTIINQLPRRKNYFKGRYTIPIGYPWLTYGAIMQLELILNSDFKVLELGSGGSTIFFSRRAKSVLSLDMNKDWSDAVKKALPQPTNVRLLYGTKEELTEVIKGQPDLYYDLVLLDIGGHDKIRYGMGEEVKRKIKMGGFLVVDNYDTKYMNRLNYTGFDVYTYDDIEWSGRGTRICIRRF